MKKFIDFFANSDFILFDGAMGTQLLKHGASSDEPLEIANINQPELVLKIHREYIKAGAQCIETNTFGANEFKLKQYGYEDRVYEINKRAVEIAKEAAKDVYVFGSVGPLGKPIGDGFDLTYEKAKNIFYSQLSALVESEVDGIIFETLASTKEAQAAIESLKAIDSDLPYIVQFSLLMDLNTIYGEDLEKIIHFFNNIDAIAVGINCGNGPMQSLKALRLISNQVKKPLSVQPNAGYPQYVQGRLMYSTDSRYFASFVEEFVSSGAKIIGGCCGTSPEHISEIKKALEKVKIKSEGIFEEFVSDSLKTLSKDEPSELSKKLGRKFIFTVEVSPPKGIELDRLISGVKLLKKAGADTVNIADSPMARVRISPIALAHILKEEVEMESILHFTCRDRNLISLQSELLGAAALGVKNVLALTGDPPSIGDHPQAKPVFDVNSEGLVIILNKLNNGIDYMGNPIGKATNFTIGVALNLAANDINAEIEKLKKKIQNGANFIETQPIYDAEILKAFLDKVDFDLPPVLGGILPLRSFKHAEFLHNEVPGITIPNEIRFRMKEAKDPIKEGIEIAYEITSQIKAFVSGIYIMPPFEKYEMAVEIINRIKKEVD